VVKTIHLEATGERVQNAICSLYHIEIDISILIQTMTNDPMDHDNSLVKKWGCTPILKVGVQLLHLLN
jgi:hypothetical protein